MASTKMSLRCGTCLRRASRQIRCLNLPRTFSTSSAHQRHGAVSFSSSTQTTTNGHLLGAVSSFSPTSSPELDAIITDFRTQVFLPAHLPPHHLRLLHQHKHHERLRAKPFKVEIADETFRLLPRDPFRDPPGTSTFLQKMLGLMKQPQDWSILPSFLTELRIAKRCLKPGQFEKIARKAHEMGQQNIIEQCIQQADRTGFQLRDVRLVREVLGGACRQAQTAKWSSLATQRALKYAERIAHLLDSPAHCGGQRVRPNDPRVQPDVIGVLLLLAAVRDVKHLGGKDVEEKVGMYTERLRARLNLVALPEFELGGGGSSEKRTVANEELQRWTPVWKGMDVATRVSTLRPDLKSWLKTTAPMLEEHLRTAADVITQPDSAGDTTDVSASLLFPDEESGTPPATTTTAEPAAEKTKRTSIFDMLLGRVGVGGVADTQTAPAMDKTDKDIVSASKENGDVSTMDHKNHIVSSNKDDNVSMIKNDNDDYIPPNTTTTTTTTSTNPDKNNHHKHNIEDQQSKKMKTEHRGQIWYQQLRSL